MTERSDEWLHEEPDDAPEGFREQPRYAQAVERMYANDRIEVTWEPAFCIHVAECLRGLPAVFDSQRRPWIVVDNGSPNEIGEVIERCPTGALHFRRRDDGPQEPVPEETTVQWSAPTGRCSSAARSGSSARTASCLERIRGLRSAGAARRKTNRSATAAIVGWDSGPHAVQRTSGHLADRDVGGQLLAAAEGGPRERAARRHPRRAERRVPGGVRTCPCRRGGRRSARVSCGW